MCKWCTNQWNGSPNKTGGLFLFLYSCLWNFFLNDRSKMTHFETSIVNSLRCMWCIALVRQVKTVSQTLQCIQNCLDKSIHMQFIIHIFYPVFRMASRNKKVRRFDPSTEEMHQNFQFQTKSSWSQNEWLVLVCNTLILQITVVLSNFHPWMIDTIIFFIFEK